jgi:hypothetical protein
MSEGIPKNLHLHMIATLEGITVAENGDNSS